ncbi:sulfatase-like hydrolase/transferase [candidate division KSB1 bacterium]|nr:sulfatase-like hydrolase/transferase [candidate division KSB1 bacterium]
MYAIALLDAHGQLISTLEGVFDNASPLSCDVPTMAHIFQRAGYRTIACGKMHFVGPDQLHGFQERLTTDIYPADFVWTPAPWGSAQPTHLNYGKMIYSSYGISENNVQLQYDYETHTAALHRLMELAGDQQPFFMLVSYSHPHSPFMIPGRYFQRYQHKNIPLPHIPDNFPECLDLYHQAIVRNYGYRDDIDPDILRKIRMAYYGMFSYVDEKVGELLKALELIGKRENTIIIFCSDHGEMMGEKALFEKRSFFEDSLRVPLIIAHPDSRHREIDVPVSLVDFFPTLRDMLRLDWQTDQLDGASLTWAFNHPQQKMSHKPVIAEYFGEAIDFPFRAAIDASMKYVSFPGSDYPERLYDLKRDPLELNDFASDQDYKDDILRFGKTLSNRFDYGRLKDKIMKSQQNRRLLKALYTTHRPDWNYTPVYDASKKYHRGHI